MINCPFCTCPKSIQKNSWISKVSYLPVKIRECKNSQCKRRFTVEIAQGDGYAIEYWVKDPTGRARDKQYGKSSMPDSKITRLLDKLRKGEKV